MSVLTNLGDFPHHLGAFDWSQLPDVASNSIIFAEFKDTLGDDFQKAWNEFINTGRAWALLLGLVVGYMFSKLTSF